MSFAHTFQEMMVILFAIGVGYVAHKLGYLGGETNKKLSSLILNITIPCMILAAVLQQESRPTPEQIRSVLVSAAVFYTVTYGATILVPLLVGGTAKEKGVWRFFLAFPNIGFIGYPIVTALFGQQGFFYAVVLGLPFSLLNYTLGPLMLSGTFRISWKQFVSPTIIVSIVSLILTFSDIRFPAMVGEMADIVGSVSIPLSLLVLGSMLASMPARSVFGSWRMWVLSAFRLLILPAVMSFVLHHLDADPLIAGVAVAQMSMPVSVNGFMMCLDVDGDVDTMARSIFLTTVLSMVTIPISSVLFMQF